MQSFPGPPRKKVVFCLPGKSFSNRFLVNWSNVLTTLLSSGEFDILVSNEFDAPPAFARTRCLGATVQGGPFQKPFQGKHDYDAIVWIDSNIVFTADQIKDLVNSAIRDHPVVSGLYLMDDQVHYACIKDWDPTAYLNNPLSLPFVTTEHINQFVHASQHQQVYMPCAYTGMGFMAIRKGVIEQLGYPWFHRAPLRIPTRDATLEYIDLYTEEMALCRNLIEANIIPAVMLKLSIRVGYEKVSPI